MADLLGSRGLASLAEAGSVAEVVEALRASPAYAPYVAGLESLGGIRERPDNQDNHRGEVERALARKPVGDLLGFVRFASSDRRAFLLVLVRGFEAENVKRVLRRIGQRVSPMNELSAPGRDSPDDPILYDLGPFATVAQERLREAAAGPLSSLLAALSRSQFESSLSNAVGPAEDMRSVLPLQMAIDDDVLAARYRAAGRLGAADREGVRRLLGTEADLLSLCWIYRSRFLFGFSPEEIIPRLPGFGRRLAPAKVRSLAAAQDPRALAVSIAATPYAALLEPDGSLRADRIDLRAARILLAEARAVRTGLRIDMGQVLAYLILVEREVQDICAIVECVHYRLGRAAAVEHLVTELM